ncbi:hypothetical protein B484DRAFT_175581 [Ochromonadaceae sp. CCMP2298]|nr:hypothetical protein B484DRAFT_175581 [Ochromonadaceae sp. CCMP2298]
MQQQQSSTAAVSAQQDNEAAAQQDNELEHSHSHTHMESKVSLAHVAPEKPSEAPKLYSEAANTFYFDAQSEPEGALHPHQPPKHLHLQAQYNKKAKRARVEGENLKAERVEGEDEEEDEEGWIGQGAHKTPYYPPYSSDKGVYMRFAPVRNRAIVRMGQKAPRLAPSMYTIPPPQHTWAGMGRLPAAARQSDRLDLLEILETLNSPSAHAHTPSWRRADPVCNGQKHSPRAKPPRLYSQPQTPGNSYGDLGGEPGNFAEHGKPPCGLLGSPRPPWTTGSPGTSGGRALFPGF